MQTDPSEPRATKTDGRASQVRSFEELSLADVEIVGGKGANLGELAGAGFPVPSGFVVTARAYLDALGAAGVRARLAELSSGLVGASDLAIERGVSDAQEIVIGSDGTDCRAG